VSDAHRESEWTFARIEAVCGGRTLAV
jgi:hypothetical protein